MVARTDYIPVPGDVVWIDFDPQAGHEQAGRRPAVTLFHQSIPPKCCNPECSGLTPFS